MNGNHSFRRQNILSFSTATTLAFLLASCGGGGGGGAPVDTTPDDPVCTAVGAAIANPVIYLASLDGVSPANLLLADAENPEAGSVVLNGPLSQGQSIDSFKLSPDTRCVVYVSDERSTGRFELYSVDTANPGQPARLNPALPADRNVASFEFSPDGQQVIYTADQDVNNRDEIYLTEINDPGTSVKLNGELVVNGDVVYFSFSPDGTQILYAADQNINGLFELFIVDKPLPEISTRVNAPFASFVELATGATFSPDGNWVGYMADQDIDEVRELYLVDVGNLGESIKLNPDYSPGQKICSFEFRPDSEAVAYCADQDTDDKLELYAVSLSLPGISEKLNSPIVAGGEVRADFSHSPNSVYVVYKADQDVDDVKELYKVDLSTPGVTEKLNAELVDPGGDVELFEIRPDSAAVAYAADQVTDAKNELYEVNVNEDNSVVKMSPPRAGNDPDPIIYPIIYPFNYSADGLRLVYITDQTTAGKFELFRVDVIDPQQSTLLNTSMEPGGEVTDFTIP